MTTSNLPQHIAIIMDGNGRWAKKRFMPRIAGHRVGVETVRKIVKYCSKNQIKVLSLFAFSSENWRRPAKEVNFIMDLLLGSLNREMNELNKNNVQLRFIGDRTKFSEKLCFKISEVERLTSHNNGLVLIIAADYGGQWDLTQATVKLAQEVEEGKLKSSEITPEKLAAKLSFADLPSPDLFIRSGGEIRISNFMLWQIAYSELYFTNILWPDFDEAELEKAIAHFAGRERRFGLSGEQINEMNQTKESAV